MIGKAFFEDVKIPQDLKATFPSLTLFEIKHLLESYVPDKYIFIPFCFSLSPFLFFFSFSFFLSFLDLFEKYSKLFLSYLEIFLVLTLICANSYLCSCNSNQGFIGERHPCVCQASTGHGVGKRVRAVHAGTQPDSARPSDQGRRRHIKQPRDRDRVQWGEQPQQQQQQQEGEREEKRQEEVMKEREPNALNKKNKKKQPHNNLVNIVLFFFHRILNLCLIIFKNKQRTFGKEMVNATDQNVIRKQKIWLSQLYLRFAGLEY